jgi:hypothetical protein
MTLVQPEYLDELLDGARREASGRSPDLLVAANGLASLVDLFTTL